MRTDLRACYDQRMPDDFQRIPALLSADESLSFSQWFIIICAAIAIGVGIFYVSGIIRRLQAERDVRQWQESMDEVRRQHEEAARKADRDYQRLHDNLERTDEQVIKEEHIVDLEEPKGFWGKLIYNEKIAVLKETLRIARSNDHQGYWQDYIRAQQNVNRQIPRSRQGNRER